MPGRTFGSMDDSSWLKGRVSHLAGRSHEGQVIKKPRRYGRGRSVFGLLARRLRRRQFIDLEVGAVFSVAVPRGTAMAVGAAFGARTFSFTAFAGLAFAALPVAVLALAFAAQVEDDRSALADHSLGTLHSFMERARVRKLVGPGVAGRRVVVQWIEARARLLIEGTERDVDGTGVVACGVRFADQYPVYQGASRRFCRRRPAFVALDRAPDDESEGRYDHDERQLLPPSPLGADEQQAEDCREKDEGERYRQAVGVH